MPTLNVCVQIYMNKKTPPTKFLKRGAGGGGLTGPQLLEGVTFFRGGCNFNIKNKLKSEIFNDEKSV